MPYVNVKKSWFSFGLYDKSDWSFKGKNVTVAIFNPYRLGLQWILVSPLLQYQFSFCSVLLFYQFSSHCSGCWISQFQQFVIIVLAPTSRGRTGYQLHVAIDAAQVRGRPPLNKKSGRVSLLCSRFFNYCSCLLILKFHQFSFIVPIVKNVSLFHRFSLRQTTSSVWFPWLDRLVDRPCFQPTS
jgi:hypothetical protein